ncbi:SDR family oxidoreductase [Flavobacterium sp. GCM10027622]|uniref:SDR family oxidoreductase n=1 Tax=unclassified Flavobacterium TaxID=196869 RepID=UPI00360B04DB
MAQISILGCGWLGLPLGETLHSKNFTIKGSTTSPEKIEQLMERNIVPFLVTISENGIEGDLTGLLNGSSILIIDIPPKLRGANAENFVKKIQYLVPFIEASTVKNVVFVSSTSVYGESNALVTEATSPNPDTESGKQLWEVEKMLQNNSVFSTTILRFGGLIGIDRNPIKQLAGKVNLENPASPINFIHQEDCIGIICSIIEQQSWGETFNAVAPFHPSRAIYYTQMANRMGLVPPQFLKDNSSTGKVIGSEKVINKLKYSFKLELY